MADKKDDKANGKSMNRTIILDGKVDESSIRKVVEKIIEVNLHDDKERDKDEHYEAPPINIIINTNGGSLYDANLAIGIIETSRTPVHTYNHSKAMSAGLYIYSAGHKRFATPLATFMYHDATIGMHNSIEGLKDDIEWYTTMRNQYDNYILSVTSIPRETIDYKKERKQDWFMTALEAYNYGLVDEIISFRRD